MAYNEELSLPMQKRLINLGIDFYEKKMFGGNAFYDQWKNVCWHNERGIDASCFRFKIWNVI